MSILDVKTLQSPTNFDLTLDAQGSGKDIIFKSDGTQVASISDAGLLTATTFAGSGASLTALPAAQLTGSLPAISGASLTGLTSSQMPAGSVLQVVQGTYATAATISSTSLVTTQLAASITPSSTSNKILVMAQVHHLMHCAAAQDAGLGWAIYQDDVLQWQTLEAYATYTYGGGNTSTLDHVRDYVFLHYLDTAGTTSATTYAIYCRRHSGASTIQVHGNNHESIITLMEIAG